MVESTTLYVDVCVACHLHTLACLHSQAAAGIVGSIANMSQASIGEHGNEHSLLDAPTESAKGCLGPGAEGGAGGGEDAGGAGVEASGCSLIDAPVSTDEPSEREGGEARDGDEGAQEKSTQGGSEAGGSGNDLLDVFGTFAPGPAGVILLP